MGNTKTYTKYLKKPSNRTKILGLTFPYSNLGIEELLQFFLANSRILEILQGVNRGCDLLQFLKFRLSVEGNSKVTSSSSELLDEELEVGDVVPRIRRLLTDVILTVGVEASEYGDDDSILVSGEVGFIEFLDLGGLGGLDLTT